MDLVGGFLGAACDFPRRVEFVEVVAGRHNQWCASKYNQGRAGMHCESTALLPQQNLANNKLFAIQTLGRKYLRWHWYYRDVLVMV